MAILLLLMLALVRMFDEASGALRKGTTSVARSAAARAAMEMITRDLEGAVIDRRFQFYKEANTVDVNYDEMYFVTMEGDPNDDRSYQLVRYYVRIQTNTYAGAKYFNFQLMRGAVSAATVKKSTGIDVLSLTKPEDNPGEWWGQINKANIWSPVRIADNIVRFDIYIHDDDGHLVGGLPGWIASNPKQDCYDSGNNSNYPSNTPPAFFDVYMQVTSDEAMKRGGLDLVAGNRREGISILYRESFLLTTRVHPATASAQVAHPSQY